MRAIVDAWRWEVLTSKSTKKEAKDDDGIRGGGGALPAAVEEARVSLRVCVIQPPPPLPYAPSGGNKLFRPRDKQTMPQSAVSKSGRCVAAWSIDLAIAAASRRTFWKATMR